MPLSFLFTHRVEKSVKDRAAPGVEAISHVLHDIARHEQDDLLETHFGSTLDESSYLH